MSRTCAYSRTLNNIIYRAYAREQTATSSRTHNRLQFHNCGGLASWSLVKLQRKRCREGWKEASMVRFASSFLSRRCTSTQIDFPLSTSTRDFPSRWPRRSRKATTAFSFCRSYSFSIFFFLTLAPNQNISKCCVSYTIGRIHW